jgi:CheY-like chemotaxis protein
MATVLVVEDDGGSRDMLADFLSENGHVVVTASSGAEAMVVAATHHPDVVLLDLALPGGIDGWEVARRLRGTSALFATTGHVHDAAIRAAREDGCEQIFFKPLDLNAVLGAINAIVTTQSLASLPHPAPGERRG